MVFFKLIINDIRRENIIHTPKTEEFTKPENYNEYTTFDIKKEVRICKIEALCHDEIKNIFYLGWENVDATLALEAAEIPRERLWLNFPLRLKMQWEGLDATLTLEAAAIAQGDGGG